MSANHFSRRQFLQAAGAAAGILGAGAVLQACGGASAPASLTSGAASNPAAGSRKADWTVVLSEKTAGADPLSEYGTNTMYSLMPLVWEPLVRIELLPDGKTWGGFPVLADKWTFPDNKTFQVSLKQGVKFHNGEELSADHVKYGFDTLTTGDTLGRRGVIIKKLGTAEVVDKYTIRWQMPAPLNDSILADLEDFLIPPLARQKAASAEDFEKNPVGGTGPYKIASWPRDGVVKLEAWDGYHRGQKAFPNTLSFRTVIEASTRVLELSAGSADLAAAVPIESLDQINKDPKLEAVSFQGSSALSYVINPYKKSPPFRDVRVRQAMNYAIDREAIIKSILAGHGTVLPSALWPGWLGYTPDVKAYTYDPAKAKSLLKDAGYPDGFSFKWSVTQGVYEKDIELAQAIAGQLSQVGIKANLVTLERAKLLAERNTGSFDMTSLIWTITWGPSVLFGFTLDAPFPDDTLKAEYGDTPPELAQARQLNKEAGQASGLEPVTAAYAKLNQYMHDQAMWLFVNTTDQLVGAQKATGWRPYPARYFAWYDEWAMLGKKAPANPEVPSIA
ncbi:MAG: ABC transporter substrate-binding protein [Chloroflexota bacterium]